jgi:rare lipoprotein A
MISSRLKVSILFCFFHLQAFAFSDFVTRQTGHATFYNNRFWGVKTTSGEKYNPYLFTAAHRYFPLGSWVEVTFPKTNKSTIVRVNDRGPYRRGAIIDISMAAAKEIGLVSFGVSNVSIRLISDNDITDSMRTIWFKRDSLNASLHPYQSKKVSKKKKKKKRTRKKSKVK